MATEAVLRWSDACWLLVVSIDSTLEHWQVVWMALVQFYNLYIIHKVGLGH